MLRRNLLKTTFLIPILAACSNLTQGQAVSDVQLIAQDFANTESALQSAGVQISATVQAQIDAAVSELSAQANTIAKALIPSTSLFDNFAAALSALGAILAPFFPAAPLIAAAVQAAMVLLQTVIASVHGTPPAPVTSAAAAANMTPDQARGVLRNGMK